MPKLLKKLQTKNQKKKKQFTKKCQDALTNSQKKANFTFQFPKQNVRIPFPPHALAVCV